MNFVKYRDWYFRNYKIAKNGIGIICLLQSFVTRNHAWRDQIVPNFLNNLLWSNQLLRHRQRVKWNIYSETHLFLNKNKNQFIVLDLLFKINCLRFIVFRFLFIVGETGMTLLVPRTILEWRTNNYFTVYGCVKLHN